MAEAGVVKRVNDDARRVLDAIRRVVRVLRVSSRAAEKQAGLSGAQLFVLQKLAGAGEERLSINELAERTLTHQSSVSVVVQRLVDRGLVLRAQSPQDGRRVELSLSPLARKLAARWPGAAQERLFSALDKMPAGRLALLASLLTQMVGDMGIGEEVPGLFFEEDEPAANLEIHARTAPVSTARRVAPERQCKLILTVRRRERGETAKASRKKSRSKSKSTASKENKHE